MTSAMGIDLAGNEKGITGICTLNLKSSGGLLMESLTSVRKDEEILGIVMEKKPSVIGIDAPLSSSHGKPFRDCDTELRKYCRVLPLTFYGMRVLMERGIKLSKAIKEETSSECIEVYPYASRKFLSIEREDDIKNFFLHHEKIDIGNKHEFDAILCALTASFFIKGKYKAFEGNEGKIIVPLL